MRKFDGKVALVTGGRTGIGRAIVEKLQGEGARVITAQRQPDPDCESIEVDFSDVDGTQKVIPELHRRAGQLDILVNNAGVMIQSSVEDMQLQVWLQTMSINLTAPFLLTQAALPHLRSTKGTIVNIGSIEGLGANPNHAAYCASKSGLHGLTRAVAVDCGAYGIRCNAVAPGWIDTELNQDFVDAMPDPERFRARIADVHPVRRTGRAEEVAELVAFLASSESGFITGQVYAVDGGRMAQLSLPQI